MKLNVNPTRMELRRLKTRLKTAVRGHKLLKDKADESVRQFMQYIRENKRLREELEAETSAVLRSFLLAGAVSSPQILAEAVCMPAYSVTLISGQKNIMGVTVPSLTVAESDKTSLYPYSFATSTAELDESIAKLSTLLVKLIRLAEVEKTCNMLADEIEKNRRRVNALEHVMIPRLKETIKFITMKLDENERSNIIRLMKVKEIIEGR